MKVPDAHAIAAVLHLDILIGVVHLIVVFGLHFSDDMMFSSVHKLTSHLHVLSFVFSDFCPF